MLKRIQIITFSIAIFSFLFISRSFANPHRYLINKEDSSIQCSVHYLVVPKIEGLFRDFSGVIYYDPEDITKSSVLLKVKTESIKTGNITWDKIIRSKRVLNAYAYPLMTFKSSAVIKATEGLSVDGVFDLHGVTKNMLFPFSITGPFKDEKGEYIKAQGKWSIDRKEFKIIWHGILDKGGVIVGNNVIVDWRMVAYRD